MAKQHTYPPLESAFTYMMKKQREVWNLSYAAIGEIVGMSKSYVSNVEKGLFDTSLEIGFAICDLLEIPTELFIDHMFQMKQMRLLLDIERACEECGVPLPIQFQRENFVPIPQNVRYNVDIGNTPVNT